MPNTDESEQKQSDMDRVRAALKAGKRVEVSRHIGGRSASAPAASDGARRASEANARDERVVQIIGDDGERGMECGATAAEVAELIKLGAVEV